MREINTGGKYYASQIRFYKDGYIIIKQRIKDSMGHTHIIMLEKHEIEELIKFINRGKLNGS